MCFYLLTIYNDKLTVQRPIIDAVRVFLHSDNGCVAIDTIRTILAVVNHNRVALGKLNRIAYYLAVLGQRVYTRNIIVVLECCYNCL